MTQEQEQRLNITNPFVYLTSNNGTTLYRINGDTFYCFTKSDMEYRIRKLCKAGYYTPDVRNILLQELRSLKRPIKGRT